jgi:hypothetical protein
MTVFEVKAAFPHLSLNVRLVPEADILAAVSHCSVPAETCEGNVRFGIVLSDLRSWSDR